MEVARIGLSMPWVEDCQMLVLATLIPERTGTRYGAHQGVGRLSLVSRDGIRGLYGGVSLSTPRRQDWQQ
jgi:hypothetical protein